MVSPIPNAVQKIWEKWNIRGVVLFSLSLQTFLILFAPLRKRTYRSWAGWSIWSAYLLADWAANFCVGLISNTQDKNTKTDANSYLMALWAPFLLLHLGGPDTITAFSLEDNELWLRHLLGLIFQAVAAAYVFLLTIPGNTLWIPTLLMFASGIIKYAERTRALYLASINTFRSSMVREPDPGPNYAKLMEEQVSRKEAGLPTRIVKMPEPDHQKQKAGAHKAHEKPLSDTQVVKSAYDLFDKYRGIIVDMIFSFGDRNESREFFLNRTAEEALRVIEVELNYIYEVFFTKVSVVRHKVGYFFRLASFTFSVAAFGFFIFEDKHDFNKFDVKVTYTLMYGALALEAVAVLMLLFSDRTVVSFVEVETRKNSNKATILINRFITKFLEPFLSYRKPRWSEWKKGTYMNYMALSTPFMFRRWSGMISGHNLITYCLHQCPIQSPTIDSQGYKFVNVIKVFCYKAWKILKKRFDKVVNYLGARDLLEIWIYKTNNPFLQKLWKFIFEELQNKSTEAEDVRTTQSICSARGEWVLQKGELNEAEKRKLKPFVNTNEVAFDQSLLTWHIATHLCYANGQDGQDDYRHFSKLLSDYMLYLYFLFFPASLEFQTTANENCPQL